jgi:hypothetical protein
MTLKLLKYVITIVFSSHCICWYFWVNLHLQILIIQHPFLLAICNWVVQFWCICKDTNAYVLPQTYKIVSISTWERVSVDGEYSGKIFDTDLSVVPGDLYTMMLTRPQVPCCHYIIPRSRRSPPGLPKPLYKRNEEKETKNEPIILRTQSYEPTSPTTARYAQWRPSGGFGARGNSTSIGRL